MSRSEEQLVVKSENISEDSNTQLSSPLGVNNEDGSSSTYSMKDEDNTSLTEDNSQEEDYEDEYDDDESGSKRGRKKRKSHSETKHRKTFMSIDVHAMRSCLHLNQKDAAKKLNVSLSTLKRRFYEMRHELGCDKWPYPPHSKGSTPTPSSTGKRKSSSTSSDEEDEYSDEHTIDSKPGYKTRRQSVTSTKRNSIHNEDSTSNMTTENHSKSATNLIERGSKKFKTAHTGFLSSVPDYKQAHQNDNSDFVFYKDMYEERSSEEDNSSTEIGSDEEYIDQDNKKKTKCDLSEISKKAQSIENPREKEIYGAAVLLIALKQEEIIPNLD